MPLPEDKAKDSKEKAVKEPAVKETKVEEVVTDLLEEIVAEPVEEISIEEIPAEVLQAESQSVYGNHKSKVFMVAGLVIMAMIGAYSIYIQQRFDHHLTRITTERLEVEAVKMEEAVKEKIQFELAQQKETKLAKKQVIVNKENGFTTVFNAAEDTIPATYRTLLTTWAKEKGFDGIVFGRIQPLFNGGVKFATYSGKNSVPLDHVIESLQLAGVTNAISVMSNKTEFWLPHPFKYQVNGDLKIYETKGFNVAGWFSIIDKKIKIIADNFEGTLDDGELTVVLKDYEPWEMPIPKEKKDK